MFTIGRLLDYIPRVQLLVVRIYTDLQNICKDLRIKTSPEKTYPIRSLEISTVNNIPFDHVENLLINSFPQLEILKFFFKTDASSQSSLDYLDDKRWETLLQSLISLKQFSCSLELPLQSIIPINTFEQNVFFQKQHWRFVWQMYTYSFNTILRLHTKPYPKKRLDIMYVIFSFFFFFLFFSSSFPFSPTKALLDDRTNNIYFRVRDLRIFIDTTIPIMSEMNNSRILSKQIRTLTLVSNKSFPESIFLRYLLSIISSNELLYLILQLDNCSKTFLHHLIERFSRLISLTISTYHSWSKLIQLSSLISSSSIRTLIVHEVLLDFNSFNSICQLFHSLECLSIVLSTLDDCYRLLSLLFIGTMKTQFDRLRSLMIKCEFDEPDAVAHWIRSNILRKFSFKCTTSILIIWL